MPRSTLEDPHYVVPDLIVEPNEHGVYEVRLADEHTPQLAISRDYQKQLNNKETDPATRDFIQKKIQSARWLIESIEQRRNTLLKVAKAIIEHQKDFLDNGPELIEPLKMQQIADRVGVHVTTVSRAVDDKWVQTPRGNLRAQAVLRRRDDHRRWRRVAWDTIKQKLLEIIAKEDKLNPLSDEEIVDEMGRQGVRSPAAPSPSTARTCASLRAASASSFEMASSTQANRRARAPYPAPTGTVDAATATAGRISATSFSISITGLPPTRRLIATS